MKFKTMLQIVLLVAAAMVSVILAAPTRGEEEETLPPVNISNKTLNEQQDDIHKCWLDAGIDHGKNSSDPWYFANKVRTTTPEECAKITTWVEACGCFISRLEKDETKVTIRYYPRSGATAGETLIGHKYDY